MIMMREGRKVLAYGAFGIMQFFLSIVLVVMTGIIFKVLPEALVISFTAAILEKIQRRGACFLSGKMPCDRYCFHHNTGRGC